MLISDLSVKKPVLALVINLLLVVFGLVALDRLSLREFPDIDPPIISIETSYTGAAAQTIENRITKVLERKISGLEGIRYIDAKSIDGLSTIKIEFTLSRGIDHAANDVRERVFSALKDLPDEADPPEVYKVDSDASVIMWLNLASNRYNALELTDYADRYLVDELSVIDGVARVRIGGEKRYAMRVWLDRQAMAAKNVTVDDIEQALLENNIELPAGRVESNEREFPVWLARQFSTPSEFGQLVIRRESNGHLLRLHEVARVEQGPENRRSELRGNQINMIGLGVIKQSQANTLAVANRVKAVIQKISLPEGIELIQGYDTSVFISQSIFEVLKTFTIALFLVVLVILLFLGHVRSMLIPFVTIPVAITATFIVLYAAGFSLNLLTLLGLVLAIGLVVDDAIVVLENINRRVMLHEPPLLASFRGTRQVGFAVIATTVVLLAVFLPISILEGNVGRLFSEFAFTLASAVVFSTVVALTLTPVMCSLILSENQKNARLTKLVNRLFSKLQVAYKRALKFSLRHSYGILAGFVVMVFIAVGLYVSLPKELIPQEDQGAFFVRVKAPEGASYDAMKSNMRQIESVLMKWVEADLATRVLSLFPQGLGRGDPLNSGFAIITMKAFNERSVKTKDVVETVREALIQLPGVIAIPVMRTSIGSQTLTQPVQFVIGGTNDQELTEWRDKILAAAKKNPGLLNVDSDYDANKIQFNLIVNYDRAAELGISLKSIGRALETLLGSKSVTTYLDRGEEYDVILESDLAQKSELHDLENIYVRSSLTQQLIPLSNVASIEETTVPNALYRFNRTQSITISASLAKGYSLGQALDYLKKVAEEQLPERARIDYKDQSRDYQESQSGIFITFTLALLVMFLVMAAQFGSFIHPIVIFITAPIAVVGGLFGLFITQNTLNIYSEIGMIMLVGLAAKNGILMVEFINQLRERQVKFMQAVIEGCLLRLRPVLMTAISTIFGSLPLILATGAGAESRMSIGVVIFFGITFATALSLFAIPVMYIKVAQKTKPRNDVAEKLKRQQLGRRRP